MADTNPYYQDTFTGVEGQTARAESVQTELDGIQGGFDGVSADIVRAIKVPLGETLNDLPAAISRANMFLRFDANGQPVATVSPFNWRGFFAPATHYFVGDIIQIGTNQNYMFCLVEHTSAANFAADNIAPNWSLFIDVSGLPYENFRLVNAAGTTQLTYNDAVNVDSTGGNIVLSLPAGPSPGQPGVTITHVKGSLTSGQLVTVQTVDGNHIMGTTETQMSIDVQNASMRLSFAGAAYGWRVRMMG